MALSCRQILLMIGMLVTGSINTLSKKAQNDCRAPGYPDHKANGTTSPHDFNHPWFQTLIMFIGETICLIGFCVVRKRDRDRWRAESHINAAEMPHPNRLIQLVVAFPTVCDLVGTSLAGIGLVYVDASVWQMLRGSIIIFAGILSRIFLKRQLGCIKWTGMFFTMGGLVLVGCSSIFKADSSNRNAGNTILGIILIISSQIVSASQMIIEETFLKKKSLHPLQVVGLEGSYGVIFMSVIVLPAMYYIPGSDVNNSYENSLDALYQIANDSRLLVFCLLYLLSIAFYNYFGLAVTKSLTAVHRTLIDACRTIIVWGIDLFVYYAFDKGFGEPFDKTYGLLQVDGFLFLLIGTALYNNLVDLSWIPCLRSCVSQSTTQPLNHQGNIQEASDSESEDEYKTVSERSRLLQGSD
ncbi:solute carrier family 35 member F6-like [Mizuhopecten yessoensis]|nr:solute carrier family 35 member F6-like [Mizuhopecten yessoensis]